MCKKTIIVFSWTGPTAAEHELDGVYNLGAGEAYGFNTVVDLINEALDTDVEPRVRRESDP